MQLTVVTCQMNEAITLLHIIHYIESISNCIVKTRNVSGGHCILLIVHTRNWDLHFVTERFLFRSDHIPNCSIV